MPRLTKIYTRKGDEGYTTLGEQRLPKNDVLVDAVGTLDELNAAIGIVYSLNLQNEPIKKILTQIQNDLFDLGGELHFPHNQVIDDAKVTYLEQTLDFYNAQLPALKEFILPRGNLASATMHLARTICRRAERSLVHLHRQIPLSNPTMICYLNRLSDLLFVLARILARETETNEIMWEHEKP